jgi:hypothetical protein
VDRCVGASWTPTTGVCDGSGSLRGGRRGARGSLLPGGRCGPRGVKELRRKLVGRFREGGYGAIEPRSRAAKRIPHRTPEGIEDAIVALRKELADLGLDAGAQTIHYHLSTRHEQVPSVCTIWRVLRRRGFVTLKGAPIRFTAMSSAFGCGSREAWPRASVPHSPW